MQISWCVFHSNLHGQCGSFPKSLLPVWADILWTKTEVYQQKNPRLKWKAGMVCSDGPCPYRWGTWLEKQGLGQEHLVMCKCEISMCCWRWTQRGLLWEWYCLVHYTIKTGSLNTVNPGSFACHWQHLWGEEKHSARDACSWDQLEHPLATRHAPGRGGSQGLALSYQARAPLSESLGLVSIEMPGRETAASKWPVFTMLPDPD